MTPTDDSFHDTLTKAFDTAVECMVYKKGQTDYHYDIEPEVATSIVRTGAALLAANKLAREESNIPLQTSLDEVTRVQALLTEAFALAKSRFDYKRGKTIHSQDVDSNAVAAVGEAGTALTEANRQLRDLQRQQDGGDLAEELTGGLPTTTTMKRLQLRTQ